MHPVVVRYTAKPGAEGALRDLVERHWPTLHAAGLVTDRRAVVVAVEQTPGVFLEYYEWVSAEAVADAHRDPVVRELWHRMEAAGQVEPWDGQYVLSPEPAGMSGALGMDP